MTSTTSPLLRSVDEAVSYTNDDASSCKRHAVSKGYWTDNYIRFFSKGPLSPKAPEISRGYYIRVKAVQTIVEKFITVTARNCQVVVLGAGFDTLAWKLKESGQYPLGGVFEVDLKPVTAKKASLIKNHPELLNMFSEVSSNQEGYLHAQGYHLLPADLRSPTELQDQLILARINPSTPTILVAECVLAYLEVERSQNLVAWAGSFFSSAAFVAYEPVNLLDKFGQVMLANLEIRNCALLGAPVCDSLITQQQRFSSQGWKDVRVVTTHDVYKQLPPDELRRLESLEFLDEVNLLFDLLKHYCIVVAASPLTESHLLGLSLPWMLSQLTESSV